MSGVSLMEKLWVLSKRSPSDKAAQALSGSTHDTACPQCHTRIAKGFVPCFGPIFFTMPSLLPLEMEMFSLLQGSFILDCFMGALRLRSDFESGILNNRGTVKTVHYEIIVRAFGDMRGNCYNLNMK